METERRTESLKQGAVNQTIVKVMIKTEKYYQPQMNLSGEWGIDTLPVNGADVFCPRTGKVSRQWLSACEEERSLTQDLMIEVASISNLVASLKQVVRNGGCPGSDGMTTNELRDWFRDNHLSLINELKGGTYRPSTVKGVEIPKPNGSKRQLGIPTVKDRLVQQAIANVLTRIYDPTFSVNSFGFRPHRCAHQALRRAGEYVKSGYSYVVDIDLEKFFDNVNHDRLMWLLSRRISDKKLLQLIGRFLRTSIMKGGLASQRIKGTPQGSPLSPLLSNIVLDELDKELERRGLRFVRYADDMIILLQSEAAANRVIKGITTYIEKRLKLRVNATKSRICRPYQLNFLGHSLLLDGNLGLSRESEQRLKDKIRELTRRNRGISLQQLIKELNLKLRGWLNYFQNARMLSKLIKIEGWLKRKIRCFRLKQCKRGKGITKFLAGLGVPKWRCILLAASHKKWFRKSGSPQAHEGMNNKWFQKIGLYSLVTNYRSNFKETALYESTQGGVRGR